jgi:tRNA(fMet)-specific endonuclease VapC
MKTRLLDSDTFSYLLRQREPVASRAKDYILRYGSLTISVITYYEVLRGLLYADAQRQLAMFKALVRDNPVLPLDLAASQKAAQLHALFRQAGTPIGDADLLIAAIALANHCVLVTNNTKHFAHVPDLELENWADPSTS